MPDLMLTEHRIFLVSVSFKLLINLITQINRIRNFIYTTPQSTAARNRTRARKMEAVHQIAFSIVTEKIRNYKFGQQLVKYKSVSYCQQGKLCLGVFFFWRNVVFISFYQSSISPDSRNLNALPEGYVVPSKQAEASWALVGGNTIAENYAFVGVHHIFDQVRLLYIFRN